LFSQLNELRRIMNKKMKELISFESKRYEGIDLDRLVIYAMVRLENLGIELSLENIIVGTYKLFPTKFSLVGYPEYPDATRVEKCLWRCKGSKRNWIGGKTPHGYQTNEKTKSIASRVEVQLKGSTPEPQRRAYRIRRKENIIRETITSPAYLKFTSGKQETVTEADFCYLLQGTLDSSHEILRENLLSLKRVAEELQRPEIVGFLSWIENRFRYFIVK